MIWNNMVTRLLVQAMQLGLVLRELFTSGGWRGGP